MSARAYLGGADSRDPQVSAVIFGPHGQVVTGKSRLSFGRLSTMLRFGRVISGVEIENGSTGIEAQMILMLPAAKLVPLNDSLLAPLVHCLERDGVVLIQALFLTDVDEAADQVMAMVGGAHA